eukprot:scaffold28323_cov112-Isochrysis_galbana.AAC.2
MERATHAASPKRSSGLDVARITSSTSDASTPAFSSALIAAFEARSERPSPGLRRWRARIPVRLLIHSSDVSTICSSSSLLTRLSGAHEPIPISRACRDPRPAAATARKFEVLR